ncbi:hypothetical protein HU200_059575 [Digitaria exilis]|uniref:Protein kinase domain-containing protein n=1 Tax=Digitaria exilis TaxID=1010633 RepID=A0A835AG59_9POAL|nr:hypothetical protein HU200_059575 [Digitaria exilis]
MSNSSIFASICSIDTLQSLDLSRNFFTDLGDLTSCHMKEGLRSLNLSSNRLSQPLSDLSQFLQLEVLDLSINSFTCGNLNTYLSSFPNLRSLNLSFNIFNGDVPTSMVGSLAELVLSGNNLTGQLPVSLLHVTTLSRFAANQNSFTGPIPSNITNHVRILDLSYNCLSGKIAPDFLSHPGLQTVDLTSNRLGENRLSGNISDSICDGKGLTYLELDNNHLTGNIPSELGKCKNLSLLNLASNNLQGTVPDAISSLDKLVVLELQDNSLSGPIPHTFSGLRSLSTLNLSHNSFIGQIPSGIFQIQSLFSLDLQANKVSGDIPVSISALTGTIPTMPTTLSAFVNLSHNCLSGSIPSSLSYLSELEILDLSYNNLSGEVPSSLGSLQSWTQLVLSYNDLSGSIPSFRQTVEIGTVGNPGLVNGTGNNNCTPTTDQKKRHTAVILIFTIGGPLVGLCLLPVIATMSLSKRIYRVGDGAQTINGRVVMNNNQTSATEFTNARPDNWQITTFQALNFEHGGHTPWAYGEEPRWQRWLRARVPRHIHQPLQQPHRGGGCEADRMRWVSGRALDEKLKREFESEASILCNIRHNNIVRLLCCLSSAESKLLVYDYMDNGSLDAWLHGDVHCAGHSMARARPVLRVPLDWPTRLIVAVGAAQGLCYMHHDCSPPIVHRDVKTSNILLDSEFRAKVADFGLARMLVQAGEPNTMSAVAGSFGYMAPGMVSPFCYRIQYSN